MKTLVFSFGLFLIIAGCTKFDEPTNKIQGKWLINSIEIPGMIVGGDGSYLIFMGGTQNCQGSDYSAVDKNYGSFNYDFSPDGTVLTIVDTSFVGGNYNYSYNIIEMTDDNLKMSAITLDYGLVTFNCIRQ